MVDTPNTATAVALPEITGSEHADESATSIANFLDGESANETDATEDDDESEDVAASEDTTDEEVSDDSDETEPGFSDEADLYEVLVDGKTEKVSREELLKGYSRQRDYSIQTKRLAEEKQQVEALKAQHTQALQNALRYVQQDPIIAEGQKLDWKALAENDPAAFVAKQYQYNARLQELQTLQQQHAAAQKESLEKTRQTEGDRLLSIIPEWKDKAKAQKGLELLGNYLSSVGFTDAELKGFTDSRAYQVAYDAARWRRAQEAKTTVKAQQVVAPAGKTVRPGAASGNTKNTNAARIKQLDSRAARTGSMSDAVDAVMARL